MNYKIALLLAIVTLVGVGCRKTEVVQPQREIGDYIQPSGATSQISTESEKVVQKQVTVPSDSVLYKIGNVSFRYPNTIELSRFWDRESGPYKDLGYFDTKGRFDLVQGNIGYMPEIQFFNNSDQHIKSFGYSISEERLQIGKYDVLKKVRDTSRTDDTSWGTYPECEIQYHIIEDKYVFCDNSPDSEIIQQAIEIMTATFQEGV